MIFVFFVSLVFRPAARDSVAAEVVVLRCPAMRDIADIDADVSTIADLPFHVAGRFPKPVAIGRCRGDQVIELSSKEMLERIRDLSLGFGALV